MEEKEVMYTLSYKTQVMSVQAEETFFSHCSKLVFLLLGCDFGKYELDEH